MKAEAILKQLTEDQRIADKTNAENQAGESVRFLADLLRPILGDALPPDMATWPRDYDTRNAWIEVEGVKFTCIFNYDCYGSRCIRVNYKRLVKRFGQESIVDAQWPVKFWGTPQRGISRRTLIEIMTEHNEALRVDRLSRITNWGP